MTDQNQNLHDLSTEERRRAIARDDYDSRFSIKGVDLAVKYGVSGSQISYDRDSDDYNHELEKYKGNRIRRLKSKSWAFAEAVLDEGLSSFEEPPEFEDIGTGKDRITAAYQELRWREMNDRAKDRALRYIQWLLEKTGDFNGAKGKETDLLERVRDIVNETQE